jgi:hypothetical protein
MRRVHFLTCIALLSMTPAVNAQPAEPLASYFGFDRARAVVVDEGAGPVAVADFNGDGRPDLAIVNNKKSRIEVHYLRAAARTPEELQKVLKTNELPPNPWYDDVKVSVAHRVGALVAYDVDGDGKPDIIYAGAQPSELIVLRQIDPQRFEVAARQRVKDLAATRDALAVADVMGDSAPELLALAGGKILVYPILAGGRLGEPATLGSSGEIRQVVVGDFDGDGRMDVLGIVPDDLTPLRLWLQTQDPRVQDKAGLLATELRFEMPAILEARPITFPKRAAASIAVLERASKRVVCYDLSTKPAAPRSAANEAAVEREVQAAVTAFPDTGSKGRSVVVADLDHDGLPDLLTTDQKANAVVLYRQQKAIGLASPESFSAFKNPKMVDVGRWGAGQDPKVFVLSDEEKTVGVRLYDPKTGRMDFPTPFVMGTPGGTPVAMKHVETPRGRFLAVIVKDRRDYALELHVHPGPDGFKTGENLRATVTPKLDLRRDPVAILPYDADHDGIPDLLILTPGESMVMALCEEKGGVFTAKSVLTKDQMPLFGLVQAAGPDNTAMLDVDGDGFDELLIADANFVRACTYDPVTGWRVVDQVNVPDAASQLVGLALLPGGKGTPRDTRIIVADKAGGRLFVLEAADGGRWAVRDRIRVRGFGIGAVRAGAFAGDGQPSVLCLADDSFAVIRLAGERAALEQFAAYRSESEDRADHTMATGDVNGDGYPDLVVLDAKDQMCQILTFSSARRILAGTEFKVFESRLFSGGAARQFEPSMAIVRDLTGNGKDDLLLMAHDRAIIYPQMTAR